MNPFHLGPVPKQRLKQWLARKLNIRYSHYHGYRFFTDIACYPELHSVPDITIFDVGANVGQTAVAFREWFPTAAIACFEPSPPSFDALVRATANLNITCHKLALSDHRGRQKVRLNSLDPEFTMNSLAHQAVGDDEDPLNVWFEVETLDNFVKEKGVPVVHILKIDTEGFDLPVLKGAEALLATGAVWNIVVETLPSPRPEADQICLEAFIQHLRPLGFELYSLFDIMHNQDGSVAFMNALFKHRHPAAL